MILKFIVGGKQEKQLYLANDTMYIHQTCTIVLLRTCTFQQ